MSVKSQFLSPMARFNMMLILGLIVIELFWGAWAGFSFDFISASIKVAAAAVFLGVAWFYTVKRDEPNIANLLIWLALFFGMFATGAVLSYLSASLALPLTDQHYFAIDKAMGFDWIGYAHFFIQYPLLVSTLTWAYNLTLPILLLVLIFLAVTGRHQRLEIFMTALFLSAIAVCLLSGLFPAQSPYAYLGLTAKDLNGFQPVSVQEGQLSYFLTDFYALRDGSLRSISLSQVSGIITFPSFHAVLTFIVVFALKGAGRLYYAAIVIFLVTAFSIPMIGSHYLIDVMAGLAITWGAWGISEHLHSVLNNNAEYRSLPNQSLPA